MAKVKRQGMKVSINELRELASELEKESKYLNKTLGQDIEVDYNQGWLIGIINKTPECIDTWRIE